MLEALCDTPLCRARSPIQLARVELSESCLRIPAHIVKGGPHFGYRQSRVLHSARSFLRAISTRLRNALDLDGDATGNGARLDGRTGRQVPCEVSQVNLVHGGDVVDGTE